MSSTGFAAIFAFCAGLGGAVQVSVQGRLGNRIGTLEALACASVIGGLLALTILLVARRSFDGFRAGAAGPKWQLLGGVMSVLVILAITVAGPRIGVVATTAMLIAGQFALATLIDRFGWFGTEQIAISWSRLLGLALLVAGAALTLRR